MLLINRLYDFYEPPKNSGNNGSGNEGSGGESGGFSDSGHNPGEDISHYRPFERNAAPFQDWHVPARLAGAKHPCRLLRKE